LAQNCLQSITKDQKLKLLGAFPAALQLVYKEHDAEKLSKMLKNVLYAVTSIVKNYEPEEERIKESGSEFVLRLGQDLISLICLIVKLAGGKQEFFTEVFDQMRCELLPLIARHDNSIFALCASNIDLTKDNPALRLVIV